MSLMSLFISIHFHYILLTVSKMSLNHGSSQHIFGTIILPLIFYTYCLRVFFQSETAIYLTALVSSSHCGIDAPVRICLTVIVKKKEPKHITGGHATSTPNHVHSLSVTAKHENIT